MKTRLLLASILLLFVGAACQRTPGEVANKVLSDFGIKERPEGYEAPSDKVFERLNGVAETEMQRMNYEGRDGEIQFEQDGLRGSFFKQIKEYVDAHPLDARADTAGTQRDSGYTGYIEYSYRVLQGKRKPTRAEAAAEAADIPTGETGRETYRYHFNSGGAWDGRKGERAKL